MSIWGRLGIAILSFTFPGLGYGLMNRRRAMVLWIAAVYLAPLVGLVVPMAVFLGLAVLIASVVMTFIQIGPVRPEPSTKLAPAIVEGQDPLLAGRKWNKPLAVIAALLSLVAGGGLTMTLGVMRLPSTSMEPTLHIGDRVTVDKLSFRLRAPERGELIVFAMPCEPERDYLKRLIAIAGDTVEVRCNVVYLNGKPIQNELVEAETCRYDDLDYSSNKSFTRVCSRYRETIDGVAYNIYHDVERPLRDQQLATGALLQGDDRDFPRPDTELPPRCPDYESPSPNQAAGTIVRSVPSDTATVCQPQLHYVVPEGHVFVMGDNRSNSNDSRVWGSVPIDNVKARVVGRWF